VCVRWVVFSDAVSAALQTERPSVLSHVERHGRRRNAVSAWTTGRLHRRTMSSQFTL